VPAKASGLNFLWSKNLIHRDLKPQNLLLTASDAKATLQIGGFAKLCLFCLILMIL
jgi:serine/threonine protein kinase